MYHQQTNPIMPNTNSNTTVSQVEASLASILMGSEGEVPAQTAKNNLFSNTKGTQTTITDLEKAAQVAKDVELAKVKADADAAKIEADKKALEGKTAEEKAEIEKKKKEAEELAKKTAGTQSLAATLTATEEEVAAELEKNKGGRPEFKKEGLVKVIEKLIKDKKFVEFEGDKPLADYTEEEYIELIEANMTHREDKIKDSVPLAFFDSLPEEFQVAYTYLANKGKDADVQHILRVVTQAAEIKNLDPTTEDGQEDIIRTYLRTTNYGTPEEIEEEVNAIKDRNESEKKAGQFKPKLDALQQKNIEQNLKSAEQARVKSEKQAANYMGRVYDVLNTGELHGIKIDKRTQQSLYSTLVQPGYLTFQGDDKELSRLVLSTLVYQDPEAFLEKVREQGASGKALEVAKKLKTEQATRNASASEEEELAGANRGVKKLQRKTNNIFK